MNGGWDSGRGREPSPSAIQRFTRSLASANFHLGTASASVLTINLY